MSAIDRHYGRFSLSLFLFRSCVLVAFLASNRERATHLAAQNRQGRVVILRQVAQMNRIIDRAVAIRVHGRFALHIAHLLAVAQHLHRIANQVKSGPRNDNLYNKALRNLPARAAPQRP